MKDQQETAAPAALETPKGAVSLSVSLCFWMEEAERRARCRLLPPEAPSVVGLAEQSPEGTEERRAPYDVVHTALPQRGLPSEVGHFLVEDFLA